MSGVSDRQLIENYYIYDLVGVSNQFIHPLRVRN